MKALETYLKRNAITQREFANRIGCSQGLVSQWINGDTQITGRWAVVIERETRRLTPADWVRRQDLLPELYRGMAA